MTLKRLLWGALTAAFLLPLSGRAQEVTWSYWSQARGWIGISVDFLSIPADEGEETVALISEVVEGSPADQAGILVGDTVTHMDGRPVSQRLVLSLPETLEPGDLVRIIVNRGGEPQEITVEAAQRARSAVIIRPDVQEMMIRLDTVGAEILKDLNSVRLSIAGLHLDPTEGAFSMELLRRSPEEEAERRKIFTHARPFFDSLHFEQRAFVVAPELTVPFEAFLVQSEEIAEVREDLTRVKQQLQTVRRQELARRRAIAAAIQGPIEEALRQDEEIQTLRVQEEQLAAQQASLTERLYRVTEEERHRQWVESETRVQEDFERMRRSRERTTQEERARESQELDLYYYGYQYRSPTLAGQNLVLGANLVPLNAEMAEVISASVDEGRVVWHVMEGTPAAEFGFRPGDVIVKVAGEEVVSIGDLRLGLGVFEGPVRIQLIRKGEPVVITVRR